MLIYNTVTGRKETFEPLGDTVKMYVCGLTPKNFPHLGHARLFVANDVIRRYLEYRGYPVRYVQNFTDIDDKTIAAGQREGISAFDAAKRYMDAYFVDMAALHVREADVFTYVTKFIPQIVAMVQGLIERGHAYAVDGDVFFAVPSFPEYGRLSGRDIDAMAAGARIEPDARKHDPRDFALWKAEKPGEPSWESPWGRGRPGWHIECSTMAMEVLGDQIDIHGGGSDLIFPHHENEIAQSESFTGVAPFVRYWAHVGMMALSRGGTQEKMAHSGTFVTIRSVLDAGTPPMALRTYLLAQHYRAVMLYTDEQLAATVQRWRRWVETRRTLERLIAWAESAPRDEADDGTTDATALREALAAQKAAFVAAMDDDFNTSGALGAIDELVHRINDYAHALGGDRAGAQTAGALRDALAALTEVTGALGIELDEPRAAGPDADATAQIEELVAGRQHARAAKDWAEADRIRKELDERYGVLVKDTPQGPTWSLREGR